jgi:predicted aspartyl protease
MQLVALGVMLTLLALGTRHQRRMTRLRRHVVMLNFVFSVVLVDPGLVHMRVMLVEVRAPVRAAVLTAWRQAALVQLLRFLC